MCVRGKKSCLLVGGPRRILVAAAPAFVRGFLGVIVIPVSASRGGIERCAARGGGEDRTDVERVRLPGYAVEVAVLVPIFSVEDRAALARVQHFFRDVRSGSVGLVVRVGESDNHLSLVLDHFRMTDVPG